MASGRRQFLDGFCRPRICDSRANPAGVHAEQAPAVSGRWGSRRHVPSADNLGPSNQRRNATALEAYVRPTGGVVYSTMICVWASFPVSLVHSLIVMRVGGSVCF